MFHRLRIPIIIIVTALLTQVIGLAVQAAAPDTLRPAGSTRYAVAEAQNQVNTSSTGWVDLPGLLESITIPSGKRGDVFIIYCGDGSVDTSGVMLQVRAMIGGSSADPSAMLLDHPK